MKICFVTSECAPFVKTGGLGDVSRALPRALAKMGCEVKVFLPLYRQISTRDHRLSLCEKLHPLSSQVGDRRFDFRVWFKKEKGLNLEYYFIDCPYYYHRQDVYTADADEDERFILLQDAVFQVLDRLAFSPDILHCNDWQTALVPVFLKEKYNHNPLFARTKSLLTIHNIGYQGKFAPESIRKAGLPEHHYYPGGPFEFFHTFSFLKAGIVFADIINTVSPTYAKEIQTPEYGAGLDGVLRSRKESLFGILNGIDTRLWNPRTDPYIPYHYSLRTLSHKQKNKDYLLDRIGSRFDPQVPTVGMVTRLAFQKGIDLLEPILSMITELPLQWIILGTGEERYESFLRWASETYPQKIYANIAFDNELAHLITAGCDMFLMPSRYEPCGLNQMYSLNYGTVPIVRKTGGLADTVFDATENGGRGNGFTFDNFDPHSLYQAITRALKTFEDKSYWKTLMKRGMRADFSWDRSARDYMALYEKVLPHFGTRDAGSAAA